MSRKGALWDYIEEEFGIHSHDVLVATIAIPDGNRLLSALIADLESLLIIRLKPPGNILSLRTRISRPGLQIGCQGDWPLRRSKFRDTL